MRIIAGTLRSRLLEMPNDRFVRPTQDKVRESVFNIIGGYPDGATVLDLFAGSGAYGLEAISRGANSVLFVDNNVNSIKAIRHNIEGLSLENQTKVVKADVLKLIPKLYTNKYNYDLVFLDPPYWKEMFISKDGEKVVSMAKKTLIMLDEYDILMPSGLIVAEHHLKDDLGALKTLELKKSAIYGDTKVSFFKKKRE